jgi:hypothetical protein
MHRHAPPCTAMHRHAPPCTAMHRHAPPCTTMRHAGLSACKAHWGSWFDISNTMATVQRMLQLQAQQHQADEMHWPTPENGFLGLVDILNIRATDGIMPRAGGKKANASRLRSAVRIDEGKRATATKSIPMFSASCTKTRSVACQKAATNVYARLSIAVPLQTQRVCFQNDQEEGVIVDEINWCRYCAPKTSSLSDSSTQGSMALSSGIGLGEKAPVEPPASDCGDPVRYLRARLPIRTPSNVPVLYIHVLHGRA